MVSTCSGAGGGTQESQGFPATGSEAYEVPWCCGRWGQSHRNHILDGPAGLAGLKPFLTRLSHWEPCHPTRGRLWLAGCSISSNQTINFSGAARAFV